MLEINVSSICRSFLFILLGVGLVYLLVDNFKLRNSLADSEDSATMAIDDFKLATQMGKLGEKKLKDLNKKYHELLQEHERQIIQYAALTAKYEALLNSAGTTSSTLPSGQTPTIDCYEQLKGESISITTSSYNYDLSIGAERIEKERWAWTTALSLRQRFRLELLETIDKRGATDYYAKMFEIDENNNKIKDLEISEFEIAREYQGLRGMQWWHPTIKLGIYQPLVSGAGWFPGGIAGIAFSRYLSDTGDGMLDLFQVGVAVSSEDVSFLLTPVSYNIGGPVPLISDLWIGADIGVSSRGTFALGISITTGL